MSSNLKRDSNFLLESGQEKQRVYLWTGSKDRVWLGASGSQAALLASSPSVTASSSWRPQPQDAQLLHKPASTQHHANESALDALSSLLGI